MEAIFLMILLALAAYMLGSIPSSVWIGKTFYNIDVREHGSGNAGTTNTFRVLGVAPGIFVFVFDAMKGWLAVGLITFIKRFEPGTSAYVNYALLLGGLAVLGHIFPLFANFKGGKGVATLLGIILAIHPLAALISFGIFGISLLLTKYVSLSSMIAGICFPILILVVFKDHIVSLNIFSIVISGLLILTHQKNIVRLLAHEENKVNFRKKR